MKNIQAWNIGNKQKNLISCAYSCHFFLDLSLVCHLSSSFSKLVILIVDGKKYLHPLKRRSALSRLFRLKLKQDILEFLDVWHILVAKDLKHLHTVTVGNRAIVRVRLLGHSEQVFHHPTRLTLIPGAGAASVNVLWTLKLPDLVADIPPVRISRGLKRTLEGWKTFSADLSVKTTVAEVITFAW